MERTSILSNANVWYNYFNNGRSGARPRVFKEPSKSKAESKTDFQKDTEIKRLETILMEVLHAVCREEKRHVSLLKRLQYIENSIEWKEVLDENLKATSAYIDQLESMISRLRAV